MYRVLALLLISLSAISSIAAAKYPESLPRCHQGDTTCLVDTINTYIQSYKNGQPDINLVNIDPLHVSEVDIIQGSKSPVNINLNFKDVLFYGLSNLKVNKVVGFDKDPSTSKFELYINAEQFSLVGKYKVKGNVIILPIVGSGPANLSMENVNATLKFIPKVELKKGKQAYVTFSDVKLDFTTTRLYMQFENLFGGDELLGTTMNQFLNENWQDILNELKPVLRKAIAKIVRGIVNPVFNKFPYNDLFLP